MAGPLLVLAAAAATKPHILQIVVDDLGYADLGYKGGTAETPNLDALADGGVKLSDYYTFTVCSPARSSILTGRYPWAIGFYWVGGDTESVPLSYDMLPQALRPGGYETVAIGKWHCGGVLKAYTPTYRGFDEFFGYYHATTESYWYHGGEGGGCHAVDFSNNTGARIGGAEGQNGTYSTHSFTEYAVDRIRRHDPAVPLYMYLAHQAAHDAAGTANGIQAPLPTVHRFDRIINDTYRVQAAAVTELDWGVGNVTAALKAKGMWATTVVVVVTDNGGPLPHSVNTPLRGGKHTYWEGGIRGEAFLHSELLPATVRGTTWTGLCHTSDWYPTIIQGVAGLLLPHDGPQPVDGFNLWPALTSGADSPRTEVITQVQNNHSIGHGRPGSVIRRGPYKLIVSNPGDDTLMPLPPRSEQPVPFGRSGGEVEEGTDHATGPALKWPAGGLTKCVAAPCLFNVVDDISESHDLAGDPQHAALIANLTKRLQEAALRGPPVASSFNSTVAGHRYQKQVKTEQCSLAGTYGFVEPADCSSCV
eukprot:TRINITY_DN32746_c0_g1_i1.p1 TRINITY_DN32746_c0_g1~~TRINITY_DN32746_c0_g1_i1.p1  ORF type:complete len:550 (+),score=153.05 TRINITY_DN32746_c0_g1_i1:54-1652(+)